MTKPNEGVDLIGFGKLAKAIPPEVYTRDYQSVLTTFEKLVAPITETAHGFGRYIRQKFDNMVEGRKRAVATYTLEQAYAKAKAKATLLGVEVIAPITRKVLSNRWRKLLRRQTLCCTRCGQVWLASQLLDGYCHPHFVEILPHFSPAEARLLVSLAS